MYAQVHAHVQVSMHVDIHTMSSILLCLLHAHAFWYIHVPVCVHCMQDHMHIQTKMYMYNHVLPFREYSSLCNSWFTPVHVSTCSSPPPEGGLLSA